MCRAPLLQAQGTPRALAHSTRDATESPNARLLSPGAGEPTEKSGAEAYFASSCHLPRPSSEPKMLILHFLVDDKSAGDAKLLTSNKQQPSSQKEEKKITTTKKKARMLFAELPIYCRATRFCRLEHGCSQAASTRCPESPLLLAEAAPRLSKRLLFRGEKGRFVEQRASRSHSLPA